MSVKPKSKCKNDISNNKIEKQRIANKSSYPQSVFQILKNRDVYLIKNLDASNVRVLGFPRSFYRLFVSYTARILTSGGK